MKNPFILMILSILITVSCKNLEDAISDADALQCKTSTGTILAGKSFLSADGCNTCFCEESGLASCTEKACIKQPVEKKKDTKRIAGCEHDYSPGGICTLPVGNLYNPETRQCVTFIDGCQEGYLRSCGYKHFGQLGASDKAAAEKASCVSLSDVLVNTDS